MTDGDNDSDRKPPKPDDHGKGDEQKPGDRPRRPDKVTKRDTTDDEKGKYSKGDDD